MAITMSLQEAYFIAMRASALVDRARREPQYAKSIRNWLALAERQARRAGYQSLSAGIAMLENGIL